MLKIGLAGVGYLGSRHLKHLQEMDNVQLSGVWDSNPTVRHNLRQTEHVPIMESFDELLRLSDAIDLVTPTFTHYELGMKVIASGRPLFVEKPLCATYPEGCKLVERAAAMGVMIQVGHIERFNRAYRALKTIIGKHNDTTGAVKVSPRFIEAHRLAPWAGRGVDVAVIYDLMIHDLDLILSLIDAEVVAVYASGVGVVTNSVDIANARLEFHNGAVANVTASRISLKRMRKIRIFGDHEYIALDFNKGTCEYVGAAASVDSMPAGAEPLGAIGEGEHHYALYRTFLHSTEGDALRLELLAFRDAVMHDTKPLITGEDGLRALLLADHVVKAINAHNGHSTELYK